MLEQLERLGSTMGISVRYEKLGRDDDTAPIRSGLCRLKENRILIVDSRLSPAMRCQALAGELKRFDWSQVFVPPAVRRLLEESENDI